MKKKKQLLFENKKLHLRVSDLHVYINTENFHLVHSFGFYSIQTRISLHISTVYPVISNCTLFFSTKTGIRSSNPFSLKNLSAVSL